MLGSVGIASGALTNAPNKLIALGVNTLTLNGATNPALKGSTITSTSGAILVRASGSLIFDGGTLPNVSVDQPLGGATNFAGTVSLASLTVDSGSCFLTTPSSITGPLTINGGGCTFQTTANASGKVSLASLTMNSGSCFLHSPTIITGSFIVNGGVCILQLPTNISGPISFASLSVNSGSCLLQSPATIAGSLYVNGGICSVQSSTNVSGAFGVSGGACLVQASISIAGAINISGGTCTVADSVNLSVSATDFAQATGVLNLGGTSGGDLRLRGDFKRSGGAINAGSSSRVVLQGIIPETFDPGQGLQLAALEIDHTDRRSSCGRIITSVRRLRNRSGCESGFRIIYNSP